MFFFYLQRVSQSHKSLKVIRIIISVETQLRCGQAEYTSVYKLQVMHMYPSASTGLSSHTPGKLSEFRPHSSLIKMGYKLAICYLHFPPRKVYHLFVLEVRQTNPSKPSKPYLNQPNPTQNLVKAKYFSQTLPSRVFPGGIMLWLQFRIKSGIDRTWHNTAQCQVSNPAAHGLGRILESRRVTSHM